LKKSIRTEEAIGKAIWNEYQRELSLNEKGGQYDTTWTTSVNRLLIVLDNSDSLIYGLALAKPKCFTPNDTAKIRILNDRTQFQIQTINALLVRYDDGSSPLVHSDFKGMHWSYDSINAVVNAIK
jgi:hypothetical protein